MNPLERAKHRRQGYERVKASHLEALNGPLVVEARTPGDRSGAFTKMLGRLTELGYKTVNFTCDLSPPDAEWAWVASAYHPERDSHTAGNGSDGERALTALVASAEAPQ